MAMATITLEVPDEKLAHVTERLPGLLAAVVNNEGIEVPAEAFVLNKAWTEVIEFLAQVPDYQSILDFKLSDELQDRIEELLFLGNEGSQTPEERAELDSYIQVIQFFDLLKARLLAGLTLMG